MGLDKHQENQGYSLRFSESQSRQVVDHCRDYRARLSVQADKCQEHKDELKVRQHWAVYLQGRQHHNNKSRQIKKGDLRGLLFSSYRLDVNQF